MYELILNDGSTVMTSMAGVGRETGLWIHVHGLGFVECVQIFSDKTKTRKMRISYDETIADAFDGYTKLVSVSVCDDFIKVGLEQEDA